MLNTFKDHNQLIFTCLKPTIETSEKDVKYIQRRQENTRTTSVTSLWWFYCWLLTYFSSFSSVSIVDFEQVNVSWKMLSVALYQIFIICRPINEEIVLSYYNLKYFADRSHLMELHYAISTVYLSFLSFRKTWGIPMKDFVKRIAGKTGFCISNIFISNARLKLTKKSSKC